MKILISSLKRLHEAGNPKITKEHLRAMVGKSISAEDYQFITGEKY